MLRIRDNLRKIIRCDEIRWELLSWWIGQSEIFLYDGPLSWRRTNSTQIKLDVLEVRWYLFAHAPFLCSGPGPGFWKDEVERLFRIPERKKKDKRSRSRSQEITTPAQPANLRCAHATRSLGLGRRCSVWSARMDAIRWM